MSRLTQLSTLLLAVVSIAGACSDSEDDTRASVAPSTAHPALDCDGEPSSIGNYDLIGPGFDTAEAALNDRLSYYQGLYGGEITKLSDDEAALQVDGSNVVVAAATSTPEGGLLVQEDYYCNNYQPQQEGTPATAPPVTANS